MLLWTTDIPLLLESVNPFYAISINVPVEGVADFPVKAVVELVW